ncbi:MAG: Zn-dependent exopeptidase M28 [Clostridia bacterium]|nr:Zn-dependent exopeptidase M28 [Clostridia bacterium]MDE7079839.1 Zn-dependent exopeptidase M28 [Clostridia bacterium]
METTEFKNGQKIYDLVKEVIDVTGPRLPGSEEEKIGAKIIADQMQRELNATVKTETFKTPRHACISAIPWLGWAAFACFCLFYLSPIISLIGTAFLLFFAITHIFYYSHLLDPLFKKDISQNVYAVIPPKSGKAKYNIMLSAHMDSSWCWLHSLKNPNTMIIKTGIGVISVVILLIVSLISIILEAKANMSVSFMALQNVFSKISGGMKSGNDVAILVFYCLPLLCLPGFYFLTQYMTYSKEKAAPGAMDNLSGVATAIEVAKHYINDESEVAKDAQFIVVGTGAEESGLVGALAFVKEHKDDKNLLNEDTYVLNLDSFRDMDNFNVVCKDTLQFVPFDKELIQISKQAIDNCNVQSHLIENPVGGSDSTAFAKAGFKTVTINAQDPRPTDYYHTTKDGMDNLNIDTLEKGYEVVKEIIRLIDEKYSKTEEK